MQNKIKFSCSIGTTDASADLGLTILLDQAVVYSSDHVRGPELVNYEFSDIDGEHVLEFCLTNKRIEHTRIDLEGNIMEDARLTIADVSFEGIELNQIFIDRAVYHHDFNGSAAPIDDKFYGEMGCNGTVRLEFTTPIYLWLLENM